MHHYRGGAVVARSSVIATLIVLFLTYLIGISPSAPDEPFPPPPIERPSETEAPDSADERPTAGGGQQGESAEEGKVRPIARTLAGKTIVIDAGHGGTDPGARGVSGLSRESYNTLFVALDVKGLLERAGANVVMTRSTDVFVPLERRAAIANQAGADIFISIHNDSNPDPSVRGISTYYYNWYSRSLADVMQHALVRDLGTRSVGVFQRSFLVVRNTAMPAVLLELGFLTNRADEQLLADPGYRYKSAVAIYNGIMEYFHGA